MHLVQNVSLGTNEQRYKLQLLQPFKVTLPPWTLASCSVKQGAGPDASKVPKCQSCDSTTVLSFLVHESIGLLWKRTGPTFFFFFFLTQNAFHLPMCSSESFQSFRTESELASFMNSPQLLQERLDSLSAVAFVVQSLVGQKGKSIDLGAGRCQVAC